MSLFSDLYSYLSGLAAVKAAVGVKRTSGPAKVYPAPVPEGTAKPYVVMGRAPEVPEHSYAGASIMARATFRIDCYGTKALEAQTVADSIVDALDGARGTMGSTTVLGVFLQSLSDDEIDSGDGSETDDHMVPLEFDVLFHRTAPSPTLA